MPKRTRRICNALIPELREIALAAMHAYLHAPPYADGHTPVEIGENVGRSRVTVIEDTLKPLVTEYLKGSVSTLDFKCQIDRRPAAAAQSISIWLLRPQRHGTGRW
jgi:hypothetical protein